MVDLVLGEEEVLKDEDEENENRKLAKDEALCECWLYGEEQRSTHGEQKKK